MCNICFMVGRPAIFAPVPGFACDNGDFQDFQPHPDPTISASELEPSFASSATNDDTAAASLPAYTYDQIADQLTDGYWEDLGESRRSFDAAAEGTITADITGLTAEGQELAQSALGGPGGLFQDSASSSSRAMRRSRSMTKRPAPIRPGT
ncbi:hypothetical protein QW131_21695 [Roseibium salinum]|nr:hypothetical protein [Roseibium salinum]